MIFELLFREEWKILIHNGGLQVLQYFGNVGFTSPVPDDFAKIEKIMNHTGL